MPRYRTRTTKCNNGCQGVRQSIYNITSGQIDDVILPHDCPHSSECWVEAAVDMEESLADHPPAPDDE